MNDKEEEFQNCLEQILNYSRSQINTLINDGFESALDVIGWKHKEVKDWCEAGQEPARTSVVVQ